MTINNKKRATSTLSPVPDMLQSPLSTTMGSKSMRAADGLAKARAKTKFDIYRRLQNDKNAIAIARKSALSSSNWSTMDTKHQERAMKDAALAKIQQRKATGNHVSSVFPIFNDYIPPQAYGQTAKEDSERDALVARQLDLLNDASARVQPEEEDDEELDPRIKKHENDDVRELKDIAPYTKGQKASTTKRGKAGKIVATDHDDSDTGDSSSADSNDEDEEVSDAESDISLLEAEEDEDEDGEDEDGYHHVTFVAVSRGRPLPSDMPVPAKAYENRKQRFSTGIKCIEQAVVRGQFPRDDQKGQKLGAGTEFTAVVSKQQSCDNVENGGRALGKSKRIKTETNA
ncbi:hypothetical protein E2P81_ATG10441 [Venturia nashicola]|nr:hypothetical protein E2P81_ATG10441 [Venturia nashicola]